MSKLDVAKENIAYLKGWLNVLLAIVFPLLGWFVTTVGQCQYIFVCCCNFSCAFRCGFDCAITQKHSSFNQKTGEIMTEYIGAITLLAFGGFLYYIVNDVIKSGD